VVKHGTCIPSGVEHPPLKLGREVEHPGDEIARVKSQCDAIKILHRLFYRIDNLLNPKGLGRTKRRAQLVQPDFDLAKFCFRIRGVFDFRTVGGFDAAFERQ